MCEGVGAIDFLKGNIKELQEVVGRYRALNRDLRGLIVEYRLDNKKLLKAKETLEGILEVSEVDCRDLRLENEALKKQIKEKAGENGK
jgi:hypothetical protein